MWFLEGSLLLAFAVAVHHLCELWQDTRARVMHYAGPYAVATYWALRAMRWMVSAAVVMLAATTLGWGSLAIAGLVSAIVLELIALCSVGLMLPMIAVVPARGRDSAQPG